MGTDLGFLEHKHHHLRFKTSRDVEGIAATPASSRISPGSQVLAPFLLAFLQELKLPTFRAHSPLLKSRRFFVDILTLLSRHCHLCPSARHLAIFLLDHFMDQYNITTSKQLYTVAVSCLLLASK